MISPAISTFRIRLVRVKGAIKRRNLKNTLDDEIKINSDFGNPIDRRSRRPEALSDISQDHPIANKCPTKLDLIQMQSVSKRLEAETESV